MKKLFNLLLLTGILCFIGVVKASAFEGSTIADGGQYYLYNLYQSKFLQSDGTTLARTATTTFTATSTATSKSITINGTAYTAEVISGKKYKLSNSSGTLMFSANTSCTTGDFSSGFNASKSEWLLISADEYNAYAGKKRFTVASLNVDGMPKTITIAGVYKYTLNSDAKEEAGAEAIGTKLNSMGYDFVGLSEDFNYHDYIVNNIGSGYTFGTHRGKIETSATAYARIISSTSPVFDIDGLGFITRDATCSFSNESWTAWNEHYGYTSDGADGLIDKGYRYYTVTLTDGTQFDVYILHMDAETSDKDNAARATQITQLADAIKASKNGRPIIIMGDTNCRYTRDKLKSLLIDALNEDSRFTVKDPWIMYGRDGLYPSYDSDAIMADAQGYLKGEVVDKVFYVNNAESTIRLNALSYAQDLSFVNDAGEALADHWPAVVEFEYHTYDPSVDDATSGIEGTYYFRNVETGYYLKAGGWWGTHAVAGDYGTAMEVALNNGKYTLHSSFGYVKNTDGDPYMDGGDADALNWTAMKTGNYYVFKCDNGALSVTTTDCKYGPNEKTVEFATLDLTDTKQQWELLTAAQMKELIPTGTAANPFNCTHLMKFANFDRNDGSSGWTNTITSDATKMAYNLGGDNSGIDNSANGNRVGEVYVSSYSGSTSYETKWDISQSFTNLPNGVYKVTCQGFYRVNYDSSKNTETGMILYATSGSTTQSTTLNCMYDLKQTAISGSTTSGGYTYPNSMAEAAAFFNAGYYPNEVTINVTDGTLKVAVAKTTTSKSSSVWTCFDNFQIYYLGEITDGSQYYIYNVDEGGFLNQGNNAGTQASLSSEGLKWTVKIADGGYTINRDGQSNYLGVAWNGLYVDWGNADKWDIAKISDGIYNITNTDRTTLVGWGGDPGNTVVAPALLPADKEPRGTRWMLMSASDYSTYQSAISSAFSARQAAWTIMRSAKANGIDYSSLQTVYDKLDATETEISSAADAVKTTITTMAANEASVTNPVEVSFYINNATCGYSDFTGWTNTNFGTNITSMPNNDNDIALAPRFYEKWVASSGTLASTGSITQSLSNLPNGCYYLVADGIAVQQDGKSAAVTGATLYAGDKQVTVNTPDGTVAEFTTDPFVVDDGTAEIGFKLDGCTANWVAIDNFRLYYVGGTQVDLALSTTAKRGTFCSPYDVTLPDNVSAWQVVDQGTNDDGARILNLTQVDENKVLAAGTPVILHLDESYSGTDKIIKQTYYGLSTTQQDTHSDKYLRGVYRDDETSISVGNYLLQNQDGVVAFYKIKTEPLTILKHRAYLMGTIDGTDSKDSKLIMRFSNGEETVIDGLTGSEETTYENIYSVSGIKQNKLQHGVNIIRMSDGSVKKVFVK